MARVPSAAVVVVTLIIALVAGRKIGWALSRAVLYPSPTAAAGVLCLLWGFLIGYLARVLIEWEQVGIVFKIIIYGEGWYLAIPNYGLVDQSTIPDEELIKHTVISNLPIMSYVAASILLAYFVRAL